MASLKDVITAYSSFSPQEESDRLAMLSLLAERPAILTREDTLTHFTSSAWVMDPERASVLMVHHNIYNAWSWIGGHADGEQDLFAVAKRELTEETGLDKAVPVLSSPLSLEIIGVQAHEKRGVYVQPHLHLNLTWFFEAEKDVSLRIKPDENSGVAWRRTEDVLADKTEPHMNVLYHKVIAKIKEQNL